MSYIGDFRLNKVLSLTTEIYNVVYMDACSFFCPFIAELYTALIEGNVYHEGELRRARMRQ